MAHPTSTFVFYPTEIDGQPAAIVVDLAAEPTPTHPYCIIVRSSMREPDAEGLRSEREMSRLRAVQEALTRRLGRWVGAKFVGFLDTAGATHFAFYAKRAADPADILAHIGKLEGYVPEVAVSNDPDWAFFVEQLYPDAYALQAIVNQLVVAELAAQGDQLGAKRPIDHAATFATKRAATAAAKKLAKAGYRVDEPVVDEDDRLTLSFSRKDALAGDRPNLMCFEILDIVLPLAGQYEGWGTLAVTPRTPSKKKAPTKKKAPAKKKGA
ncbi:MAG: DUF695 domain-containing protein [Polyangiaceae bacterium]|nr:DUF695 domain-containing protein [Polyangiaceae bacterium]